MTDAVMFERLADIRNEAFVRVEPLHALPIDINPASPGDSPVREVMRYYDVNAGEDNGDFANSKDRKHFRAWSGRMKPQGMEE